MENKYLNRNNRWVKDVKNAMQFSTCEAAKEMAEILDLEKYHIEKIHSNGEIYYVIEN